MHIELRKWRQRLGWTQAQAAAHLGIPERTYEGWERDAQPKRPANEGAVRKLMEQALDGCKR